MQCICVPVPREMQPLKPRGLGPRRTLQTFSNFARRAARRGGQGRTQAYYYYFFFRMCNAMWEEEIGTTVTAQEM